MKKIILTIGMLFLFAGCSNDAPKIAQDYMDEQIKKTNTLKKEYTDCKNKINNELMKTNASIIMNSSQLLLIIEAFNFCTIEKRLDILQSDIAEIKAIK